MISIRMALIHEASAIWSLRRAAIYKGCAGFYPDETLKIWAETPPSDQFKQTLASDCYVAIMDACIAGMGMLNLQSGKVDAMFVDPQHMRRGIGKQILTLLEKLAREQGVGKLHLDASLNAVPFYRACGFSGEQAATYQSPVSGVILDCMQMQKILA
nr:GNAT family N-acetyltransferase [Gammaproteobacteria bacterium]